jgi:hypothetical protein
MEWRQCSPMMGDIGTRVMSVGPTSGIFGPQTRSIRASLRALRNVCRRRNRLLRTYSGIAPARHLHHMRAYRLLSGTTVSAQVVDGRPRLRLLTYTMFHSAKSCGIIGQRCRPTLLFDSLNICRRPCSRCGASSWINVGQCGQRPPLVTHVTRVRLPCHPRSTTRHCSKSTTPSSASRTSLVS